MKRVIGWMVIGLLVSLGATGRAAQAEVAVQGGAIGSGEEGSALKTHVMSSAANVAGKNAISGFGKGSLVLGLKTVPNEGAAAAYCTLYDALTVVGAADSAVIDELPETNHATGPAIQLWPYPFRLTTGLSIGAKNATCIVYYR